MKKIICSLLFLMVTGCGGPIVNWEQAKPSISRFSEIAATVAFSSDTVKPHTAQICSVVSQVSSVLSQYDDPQATFAKVRELALSTIGAIPETTVRADVKRIASLVVDQVLDSVFSYVQESYSDMVKSDQAGVALSVARSVSDGLNQACIRAFGK